MRAQDGARCERLLDLAINRAGKAQAQRPLRACVILRLDGAKPGDKLRWLGEPRPVDMLVEQAQGRDVG
jgi:hypothetical protein